MAWVSVCAVTTTCAAHSVTRQERERAKKKAARERQLKREVEENEREVRTSADCCSRVASCSFTMDAAWCGMWKRSGSGCERGATSRRGRCSRATLPRWRAWASDLVAAAQGGEWDGAAAVA